MRLLIRNRWYSAPVDPNDLPVSMRTDHPIAGYNWIDRRTDTTVAEKTVFQYTAGPPERFHNWHSIKLTNGLPAHSAIIIKMRLWTKGFCTGSALAIDVDGDTIFAHVSHSDGMGKFTDSLRNGGFRTSRDPSMYVYVHPKGGMDAHGVSRAEITQGHVLPVLWTKAVSSDNPPSDSGGWFYWDVEAVAPHSNVRSGVDGLHPTIPRDSDSPDAVTINIRSISNRRTCDIAQHTKKYRTE